MENPPQARKRDKLKGKLKTAFRRATDPTAAQPPAISKNEAAEPKSTAVSQSSKIVKRTKAETESTQPESLWNTALSRLECSSSVDDRNRAQALRDYVADHGVTWSSGDIIEELRLAAEAKQDIAQQKAWKIKLGTRTVALREVAARLVDCLNKFKEIGDLAVQYDPVHAALPWAAFRLILQVATLSMEQEGQVLTAMDAVMHAYVRACVYQRLYLGLRKRSDVADALEGGIINQFSAICAFLGLAVDYYSSGSAMNTVKGLLNPSALAKCIEKITEAELQVEKHARVCAAVLDEETRQRHGERLDTLGSVLAGLRDSFGKLQVGSTTIEAGVGQLLEALTASQTHEIMKWISEVPYESDLYNLERGRLIGTCEWLIAHDTYLQWKRSPASMILWLHGIRKFCGSRMEQSFVVADWYAVEAGAGKTKLSTKVVNDMASEDGSLAYFFCDRNQQDRSDPLGVLLSITKQLSWVIGQKYVRQCTVEAYNRKKNDNFASNMFTPDECQEILLQLAAEVQQSIIIVDGLDECNERTRGDVLKTLDHLVRQSTSVIKVFVASRNDKDLTQHFSNSPNLEIEAAHNQDDIEKLVVDRISNNKWASEHMTVGVRQKVVQLFREKSQGMFQWAALHIDDLLEIESNEDTLKWLNSLPKGLEAAYDRIYHSIEEKGDKWLTYANRVFMWLMSTSSPIELEILCILACQDAGQDFNPNAKLTRISLLSFCRNLVKVDDADGTEVCRFAHLSVQEYLERRRLNVGEAQRMSWRIFAKYGQWTTSNEYNHGVEREHLVSTISYMAYHSVSSFMRSVDMHEAQEDLWNLLLGSTKGPDVIFGSLIWHTIGDIIERQARTALRPLIVCLDTPSQLGPRLEEGSTHSDIDPLEERTYFSGPIAMCVNQDIQKPIKYWLTHQIFDPKTDCGTARALLFVAWQKQHFKICNMLLDAGTNFEGMSSDNLQLFIYLIVESMPREGPQSILLKLLKRLFEDGASAAGLGRLNSVVFTNSNFFSIAQLILENGADPTPLDGTVVDPPLVWAVCRGDANIETIKLLLDHGADPNMWHPESNSPLQYAVIQRSAEAVKLLLDKGADINAVSDGNGTALHTAASRRFNDLYDLLLENGADPGIQCYIRDNWYSKRLNLKEGRYSAEQIHEFVQQIPWRSFHRSFLSWEH